MNLKCETITAGNIKDLGTALELWAASMPIATKIQNVNVIFNANTGELDALITYIS